jgi:uncharacterized protein
MPAPQLKSPCVDICIMDPKGYCQGCWRTMQEITRWRSLSHREQKAVLADLGERARRFKEADPD